MSVYLSATVEDSSLHNLKHVLMAAVALGAGMYESGDILAREDPASFMAGIAAAIIAPALKKRKQPYVMHYRRSRNQMY